MRNPTRAPSVEELPWAIRKRELVPIALPRRKPTALVLSPWPHRAVRVGENMVPPWGAINRWRRYEQC